MRQLVCLLALLFAFSCTEKEKYSFEKINCEVKESTVNSNLRRIFKPCREYIFRARYWDRNYELVSDEYIWMMATGREWEYEPESQDEIAIQYLVDQTKIDFIQGYNINPEFAHPWKEGEVTGIIETDETVWMHPFRSNQYIFTEVASFPYVKLPLHKGNQWTSNLHIYEGWGSWSYATLNDIYTVIEREVVETEFRDLEAWHIKGVSTAHFGTSIHDFWYHEEYGFVKMVINNYAGQVLIFELVEVKE